MFKRWINWLKGDAASDPVTSSQQRRRVSAHAALHARSVPKPTRTRTPDIRETEPTFEGTIDDTGARESLKLFDDAPLDPGEPTGIDPYNSGQFDRSRHWDSRFRD